MTGEIATTADAGEMAAREAERVAAELSAGLRRRGSSVATIDILDISTHGFRGVTHLDLGPGDDIWLRLPGVESWHAKVVWSYRYTIGCRFERPLYPAVLDNVLKSAN